MAGSASKTRRAILALFIWAVAILFFMAALHPNGNSLIFYSMHIYERIYYIGKQ